MLIQGIYTIHIFDRFMILIKNTFIPLSEKTLNQFPRFYSRLVFTLVMISQVFITISCPVEAMQIPDLDTKGDVYKTEGANDSLIYDSTIGNKKCIMLYADFSDAVMKVNTKERANGVLGNGLF